MIKMKTDWNSLGISNDFIFGKVMTDPALCMELLQKILPELNISSIQYPELQKSIRLDKDARSIRLDVYVIGDNSTVYNIEMQTIDTKELPKRTRYYQSIIDLQLIDKGETYTKLNNSYIIFICPFDLFGKNRHIYTFEYICKEDNYIHLQDGTTRIFLNADGNTGNISEGLKAFLDLVAGRPVSDPFGKKLEDAVKEAKKNREWRHEYMTLLMRDMENIEKGMEKGIEQGMEQERRKIIMKMLSQEFPVEQIMAVCDASRDEIEVCRKNLSSFSELNQNPL
ncbi:Rpn family recombination-promoting nuclease/putative transposase [Lacrimispora sp.]|uniref:Rpn family recombination-promoting nuclease/putative transposase n=1 Tax=Lacrimispora sp. TaxID=2719234 RepID=UPI002FD92577